MEDKAFRVLYVVLMVIMALSVLWGAWVLRELLSDPTTGNVEVVLTLFGILFFGSQALILRFAKVRGDLAQKRYRENLCQFCGYDLRATPKQCPECGRVTLRA